MKGFYHRLLRQGVIQPGLFGKMVVVQGQHEDLPELLILDLLKQVLLTM